MPVDGIPDEGVSYSPPVPVRARPVTTLGVIDAKGLGMSAPERAEVPHSVGRIPDESARNVGV